MAVWTVFQPDEAKGAAGLPLPRWAERVVFVREAVAWSAVLLAPLVLLRHRLWLAFIVYAVLQGLIGFAIAALELDAEAGVLFLLPNLIVALEMPGLRRRKLAARGYEELGAVVAPDFESAERRFFEGWLSGATTGAAGHTLPPVATPAAQSPAPAYNPVLGLFPEASGR